MKDKGVKWRGMELCGEQNRESARDGELKYEPQTQRKPRWKWE